MRTWTPEEVREELPDVPVRVGRKRVLGQVRGRQNAFATVYVGAGSIEVAWPTVAHVLNTGGAVRM